MTGPEPSRGRRENVDEQLDRSIRTLELVNLRAVLTMRALCEELEERG